MKRVKAPHSTFNASPKMDLSVVDSGNLGNKPAHYFGLNGDFIKHFPVLFRPSFNISVYQDLVSARGDVTWLNGKIVYI